MKKPLELLDNINKTVKWIDIVKQKKNNFAIISFVNKKHNVLLFLLPILKRKRKMQRRSKREPTLQHYIHIYFLIDD